MVTKLYRITNTAHSPFRYVMDPQEQLGAMLECDRNGWDIMAFYHSHTHSPAHPSQTDVRMALQSGYLDEHYVLVSLENADAPAIRAFKIDEVRQHHRAPPGHNLATAHVVEWLLCIHGGEEQD